MNSMPPRYDLIPRSVQHAMILRGDLLRCGTGVRGIAWPDNPTVRLTALAPYLLGDRIASHHTAAWVWRATSELNEPLQFATTPKRGHSNQQAHCRLAQLTFSNEDVACLGHFMVTTPLRTAFDLLHEPSDSGAAVLEVTRQLLALEPHQAAALSERLARGRRPYTRLARRRLATILETPAGSLP